ncbi:flagellar FliJ family protein [Bacteriovoracaceae bacterium]|nr:flagellar FliJ family protein [Bacteriovoracaceae bacterium]
MKLRKLEEDQAKMALSLLQKKRNEITDKIAIIKEQMQDHYLEHEQLLKKGLTARQSRFIPYFNEGKRAQLKKFEMIISEFDEKILQARDYLNSKRGNVKVIEKIKEKDVKAYKKEQNKKLNEELDERFMMRKAYESKL